MASYHLKNGVGEPVKCAHDPCKLHGSSDFEADSIEQARVIAEQLLEKSYAGVNKVGLGNSARSANGARTKALKGAAGLRRALTAPYADDPSLASSILNRTITASLGEKNPLHGKSAVAVSENAVFRAGAAMSREDALNLIEEKGDIEKYRVKARSLTGVNDPSANEMAQAVLMEEFNNRLTQAHSDRTKFSTSDIRRIHANNGRILNGDIALDRKLPESVKRSIIRNAWENSTPKARGRAISSMNPDILRHIPPEAIARSLRHRSQKDRMAILNLIGKHDERAMEKAIVLGALGRDDAMSWTNKHPTKDSNGEYNDSYRTINAYLRAKYVRQGHAKYTPKQIASISSRMRNVENFKDSNGRYSARKHAEALYRLAYGTGVMRGGKVDKGYLPAATVVISERSLPRPAMIEFQSLCNERQHRMEEDAEKHGRRRDNVEPLAHSRYQWERALHGKPYMERWFALKSIIPHLYDNDVSTDSDAVTRERNRVAE